MDMNMIRWNAVRGTANKWHATAPSRTCARISYNSRVGMAHDVTLEAQELEPFYDMGTKEIVNRWKHIFFIPPKQKTILDYPTKIGE